MFLLQQTMSSHLTCLIVFSDYSGCYKYSSSSDITLPGYNDNYQLRQNCTDQCRIIFSKYHVNLTKNGWQLCIAEVATGQQDGHHKLLQ